MQRGKTMFEEDIKTINSISMPEEPKKDILDCINAKIQFLLEETPDNLYEVKRSFELAFTDIKSLQASHLLSPADFSTIEHIIRKIDE